MENSSDYIFACLDSVYNAPNNNVRIEAYQKIEAFQQQLTSVDHLATLLSACQTDAQRNFGLHCMLCYLRNTWNRTLPQHKQRFKVMVFSLVASPGWPELESLCKVIVELVKREWPQYWASFVAEMTELSSHHVSLVLSVFLRLSEDVFEFHKVPPQRRKDILTGLNENADAIFGIVYNCLVSNVRAYVAMAEQGNADSAEAGATVRVCRLALETLTALTEWVKTDYLLQEDALLVRMLVQLLPLPHVCYESAEAVLLCFEHKVKSLEPKTFVNLVTSVNVLPTVANCLEQLSKLTVIGNFEDNFSQRLCQIVCCIGHHLVAKVIPNSNNVPPIFASILELITFLLNFPSKPIVFNALKLLLAIARSEHAKGCVEPALPQLLDGCRQAQLRQGLPSEVGNASSEYSRVQFGSDDDYVVFFAALRSEACQTLQAATQAWPVVVANHLLDTLASHTAALSGHQEPPPFLDLPSGSRSPTAIQWDGLANHCDAVLARLPGCLDSPGVDPAASERVRAGACAATDALLNAAPGVAPHLRACLLTALTAFLPFLAADRGLTMRAVQCVFNTLSEVGDGLPMARTRAQREMRKHAVVCLLRMCKAWPAGLLPLLGEYCAEVARLCQAGGHLNVFESASLIESVVLLSNHLPDMASRRATIEGIMSNIMSQWLAPDLTQVLSDPALFLRVIGLDKPAGDANGQTARIQIHNCLTTIYNTVRSCVVPDDGQTSPVSELASQMWPNMLRFMRCLQRLHTPAMRNQFHPDFSRVFDMEDSQKYHIVGIVHLRKQPDSEIKTPLQKMSIFLTESHASGLRTIVHAAKAAPALVDDCQLCEHLAVETDLHHMNDLLLSDLLRTLSTVIVRSRPGAAGVDLAGNLCRRLLGHSLARLNERWTAIIASGGGAASASTYYDNNADVDADANLSDEVIAEQCLRRLARAFLDLLHCLLLCGSVGNPGQQPPQASSQQQHQQQAAADAAPPATSTIAANVLLVDCEPELATGALACLYDAIVWPDGPSCQRAAVWAAPVTRQLRGQLAAAGTETPRHLLMQVLRALRQHGPAGEAAVVALVNLFLCLYDCFHAAEGFRRGLAEWTGQPAAKLDELDSRLGLRPGSRPVVEKIRREIIRRFLDPFIGKPISEQFKLAPNYKNLPPLFKAAWKRRQTEQNTAARENLEGLVSLFNEDDS